MRCLCPLPRVKIIELSVKIMTCMQLENLNGIERHKRKHSPTPSPEKLGTLLMITFRKLAPSKHIF
jgi:hypothetical protein